MKIKKIGILGGTFNPVHTAHLMIAQAVHEKFKLDRVLFIPCHTPYHKNNPDLVSPTHRFKMLELAVAPVPYFRASDIDIKKGGYTYSIDTLSRLRKTCRNRAKFYFIIGADTLKELPLWYKIKKLGEMCEFITVARLGYDKPDLKALAQEIGVGFAGKIKRNFLNHPIINVSSSEIRSRLKNRRPIKYLVPPAVEQYIFKHKLYR